LLVFSAAKVTLTVTGGSHLFPELHVTIKHAIVELLLVREHAPPDLLVIQKLVQHLALAKTKLCNHKEEVNFSNSADTQI